MSDQTLFETLLTPSTLATTDPADINHRKLMMMTPYIRAKNQEFPLKKKAIKPLLIILISAKSVFGIRINGANSGINRGQGFSLLYSPG